MSDSGDGRMARRWAARWHAPQPGETDPPGEVVLTAAMRLLSDYEDAVYASCRHALVPTGQAQTAEDAHMVEAVRLHADVRRLRHEILALMTGDEQ